MENERSLEKVFLYGVVGVTILAIATFCRFLSISIGWDNFTSNIVFITCVILCFSLYSLIQLVLMDTINIFFKKKIRKKEIDQSVENITDNIEESEQQKHDVKLEESKEEIKIIDNEKMEFPELVDVNQEKIEEIRKNKEKQESLRLQGKLKIAIDYTVNELAAFVSTNDLDILCANIKLYAEKENLENIKPIKVNGLNTIDIYHFGWNIWNYFKIGKQNNIVIFLKNVFPEQLKQVKDDETIKKNLKKEELKGIIKIKENLIQDEN